MEVIRLIKSSGGSTKEIDTIYFDENINYNSRSSYHPFFICFVFLFRLNVLPLHFNYKS
jgi:hypothetical protein